MYPAPPSPGTPPPLDALLTAADNALRALFAPARASREPPGLQAGGTLAEPQRRQSAALMRVNHAGEVAAQALYHGQAMFAREPRTRDFMLNAARDEGDHLAWCEDRLRELHSRTSMLNPLWYAGSFAIGAAAALFDDAWSLGFVTETERQVEGHLEGHLRRLPAEDARSRTIVEAMKADEVGHAAAAERAGARPLPEFVRRLMRLASGVMTRTAYWL
jgi:ubiquinone biosynthesis monooxygenase Coq7